MRKQRIEGNPDPKHVSTSYAERNNLNVRMHSRRLTRLTNAFSKKVANHAHAMALHLPVCSQNRVSFIPGPISALPSHTRGKSRITTSSAFIKRSR
jgi:hypothetical protein